MTGLFDGSDPTDRNGERSQSSTTYTHSCTHTHADDGRRQVKTKLDNNIIIFDRTAKKVH